jgi:hypothetical protein
MPARRASRGSCAGEMASTSERAHHTPIQPKDKPSGQKTGPVARVTVKGDGPDSSATPATATHGLSASRAVETSRRLRAAWLPSDLRSTVSRSRLCLASRRVDRAWCFVGPLRTGSLEA